MTSPAHPERSAKRGVEGCLFALLLLSACSRPGIESDGAGGPRWSRVAGSIGAICAADSDCIEGANPECFRERVFNGPTPLLPTANGYCSSHCEADADCGEESRCADFATYGKWCVARCGGASDCRDDGYACVFRLGCFPDGNLSCDPTAAEGACTTGQNKPGGCIRAAYGPGRRGYCWEQCIAEADQCADENGRFRQCTVIDATRSSSSGEPSGDHWKGPVCVYSVARPNEVGKPCVYDDGTGQRYYPDTCVDGAGCYLQGNAPSGQGYDEAGDNRCHYYCNPQQSGSCPRGVCRDVWGLHTTGLCIDE